MEIKETACSDDVCEIGRHHRICSFFFGRIKLYQAVRSIQIILVYITVIIQFGGIYIPIGWIAGIYNFYSISGIKFPGFVGCGISLGGTESQISFGNAYSSG